MKPIIVFSHERSGTHLLINLINYENSGNFKSIGYDENLSNYNKSGYYNSVIKNLIVDSHVKDVVLKSHHQSTFVENFIDYLLEKYSVIYIKREVKDVLCSYYKFLSRGHYMFPSIDDWVFSNPDEVGRNFIVPYFPDPHVLIEPMNYVDRWKIHTDGWGKYKNDILILNYEDILLSFSSQKPKIESYIGKKISDNIIDIKNKNYPNYFPNKGIIGSHKEIMSNKLIDDINKIINK